MSAVSERDQTKFQPEVDKTKQIIRKLHRLGRFKQGVSKQMVTTFALVTRMTVRCRSDRKRRHCTSKRLSRAIWLLRSPATIISYRAIFVAIVLQNSLVFVLTGYRTIIARYIAKWGIAQLCLCKTKYRRGGYRTISGECKPLKKYRAIWVSQQ